MNGEKENLETNDENYIWLDCVCHDNINSCTSKIYKNIILHVGGHLKLNITWMLSHGSSLLNEMSWKFFFCVCVCFDWYELSIWGVQNFHPKKKKKKLLAINSLQAYHVKDLFWFDPVYKFFLYFYFFGCKRGLFQGIVENQGTKVTWFSFIAS